MTVCSMEVFSKEGKTLIPTGTIITDVGRVKHLLLNDLYEKYVLEASYITRISRAQRYTHVELKVFYRLPRADGSTFDRVRLYIISNE